MTDESVLVSTLPVEQNPSEADKAMIIGSDGKPKLSPFDKMKSIFCEDPRVGDLSDLDTTAKDNLVEAINEVYEMVLDLQNPLTSISAFVRGGFYFEGDPIESLRLFMVVTAHYQDGTSKTVSDYTLSADFPTLVEGDNVITVTYKTKQTTVTVEAISNE